MDQFSVPNRLKAIKNTSSGLIGKFTIKTKIRILFESSFFYKIFLFFFAFFKSPRDKSLIISRFF